MHQVLASVISTRSRGHVQSSRLTEGSMSDAYIATEKDPLTSIRGGDNFRLDTGDQGCRRADPPAFPAAYLRTRTRSTVTSAPPVIISSRIGSRRSTCA
jgi:hypothetical protein